MTKIKKLGLALLSTSILSGCCVGFATSCGKKESTTDPKTEAEKYTFKDENGEQTKKILDSEVNTIEEAQTKLKNEAITNDIIGLKDGEQKDDQYTLYIKSVQITDYDVSQDELTITIKKITFQVYASKDGKETTVVEINSGDADLNASFECKRRAIVEADKYEFIDKDGSKIRPLINVKKYASVEQAQNAIKEAINQDKDYCGIIALGKDKVKDDRYTLTVDSVSIQQQSYESQDGDDTSTYALVNGITIVANVVKDGKTIKVDKPFKRNLSFTYFCDYSAFMYVNQKQVGTDQRGDEHRFNKDQVFFFDNKDIGLTNFKDNYKDPDLKKDSFSSHEKYWVIEITKGPAEGIGAWDNPGVIRLFTNKAAAEKGKSRLEKDECQVLLYEADQNSLKDFSMIRRIDNRGKGWGYEGFIYIFKDQAAVDNYASATRSKLGFDYEMWKIL